MKKTNNKYFVTVLVIILLIITFASCSVPDIGDPSNDISDNEIGDIREVSDNGSDERPLLDLNQEELDVLYSYIPFPEYYHTRKIEVIPENPDISEPFIDAIVKEFGLDKYDLQTETDYRLEYLQDAPRIPYDDVHSLYEKMYGMIIRLPNKLHFPAKGIDFIYEEATDSYVLSIWQGDGNEFRNGLYYRSAYTYEIDGEYLYMYDKFAQYLYMNQGTGSHWYVVYGSNYYGNDTPVVCNVEYDDYSEVYAKLFNGEMDEILPIYKHTFKLSEDGTYYHWFSTEPLSE